MDDTLNQEWLDKLLEPSYLPYCPLDGVRFAISDVMPSFLRFVETLPRIRQLTGKKVMYRYFVKYGPLTMFWGPRFKRMPEMIMKVNPAVGHLSCRQVISLLNAAKFVLCKVTIMRVDYAWDFGESDKQRIKAEYVLPSVRCRSEKGATRDYKGTQYAGARGATLQLVIYDKAQQERDTGRRPGSPRIRLEVRHRVRRGKDRMTLDDFVSGRLFTLAPYHGLMRLAVPLDGRTKMGRLFQTTESLQGLWSKLDDSGRKKLKRSYLQEATDLVGSLDSAIAQWLSS